MVVKNRFTVLDEDSEKKIAEGAVLAEKKKSNAGRKKKAVDEKLDEMLAVYFNKAQKQSLQEYCDKIGISFSTLVKQLLVKEGLI